MTLRRIRGLTSAKCNTARESVYRFEHLAQDRSAEGTVEAVLGEGVRRLFSALVQPFNRVVYRKCTRTMK
jgi:hypothetical protein